MQDYISLFISTVNNELLTNISKALDSDIIFGIALLTAMLIGERRREKIKKIIFAFVLAFIISAAAKEIFKINRPCINEFARIDCPNSYAFPSTHAALSFTLAIAFLNKRSYPAYLLFAVFVSFTRIYLTVHSLVDVGGGIAVAGISYYITDLLIKNGEKQGFSK
ncbi:phosphatase PAP2 family protein [Candidatus Micrarchaeota archaeon]|nr:phosphatase PAP2 family protein [Candidatus Micrarchaeota archaeon]